MMNNLLINNFRPGYGYQKKEYINNYKASYNPSFGNSISMQTTPLIKVIENCHGFVKFSFKKILNSLRWIKNHKKIDSYYRAVINIDNNSPEYMQVIHGMCRQAAKGKEVEINVESGRIKNITESNESCIFIINHNNPEEDPQLLGFFNALLAREYLLNNKAKSCPRPKIMLNEGILRLEDSKTRAVRKKFGAIGIDASISGANDTKNARNLIPTIKEFTKNRAHIFIFPEGKMAFFDFLSPEYKFQTGVADIISAAAKSKERVKVVPLGFAYSRKLRGIHIGEPMYFKQNGENLLVTKGNLESKFTSLAYTDFFRNGQVMVDGFKLITAEGKALSRKELPNYISGLLCENLKVCKKEAEQSLLSISPDSKTFIL